MARRRPAPAPAPSLLGAALSFVAREVHAFVASATGSQDPDPAGEFSADEDEDGYDDEDDEYEDYSPPRRRRRSTRDRSRTPPRKRRRTRRASPSPSPPRNPQATTTTSPTTSTAAGPPISLARILKRRPSFTMPGSLFPRSPSMEPDAHRAPTSVRFASRTTPPPPPISPPEANSHPEVSPTSPSTPSTPRRRGAVVGAAADRFYIGEADAGPAILLPSPRISPHASPRAVKGKGKARADARATPDADSSGLLRVRGKEQELDAARADLGRHERRLGSVVTEDADTSFVAQVERARDADRARIVALEAEIARLKHELARRPTSAPSTASYPPPPPPPPPPMPLPRKTLIRLPAAGSGDNATLFVSARAALKQAPTPVEAPIVPARRAGLATMGLAPDKMAAFLTEMKTVRLRRTGAAGSGSSANGVGTANATFTAPTPPSRVAGLAPRSSLSALRPPLGLSRDGADMSRADWDALRDTVRAEMDGAVRVGEKRKRGGDSVAPGIRPNTASVHTSFASTSTPSAHSSFASTSTSSHHTASASTSTPPSSLPASQPLPPPTTARQTPSITTSAPTPSLCSDNDNDAEPPAPATPPLSAAPAGPSRAFYRFKGTGEPGAAERSMRGLKRREDAPLGPGPTVPRPNASAGTSGIPRLRANARPRAAAPQRMPTPPLTQRQVRTPSPSPPRPAYDAYAHDEHEHDEHEHDEHEHENAPDAVEDNAPESSFIRPAASSAPRTSLSVFARRPPSSPLPAQSPRRPRAPRSVSNSRAPTAGAPGHTPGPRRASGARTQTQIQAQIQARTQQEWGWDHAAPSEPTPPRAHSSSPSTRRSARLRPAPALPEPRATAGGRRLTLDAELRAAVPFLHADDEADEDDSDDGGEEDMDISTHVDPREAYMASAAAEEQAAAAEASAASVANANAEAEADLDSGVLLGVGMRSRRLGFLARGGAGGPPVFLGVGYVAGAEAAEAEEEERERGIRERETRMVHSARYADAHPPEEDGDDEGEEGEGEEAARASPEYEYVADDDDDDEYVPSPAPKARLKQKQRRR